MLGSGRDCPEALAKGSSGSQAENLAISLGSRWGTRGTRTKERPPSLGGRSRCVLWTYLRAGDGARTRAPPLGRGEESPPPGGAKKRTGEAPPPRPPATETTATATITWSPSPQRRT